MDMVNHNNNKSIIDICPKLTSYNITHRERNNFRLKNTLWGAPQLLTG